MRAAADYDQAVYHVLVRGISGLPAEIPQHLSAIGLESLASKRLGQADVALQP